MPGKFHPVPLRLQLRLILQELNNRNSAFGIPAGLFFYPENHPHLGTALFGHQIHNPVGVAAGPHTQLAQNIIAAWLTGARYIELKTVQTLDMIDVSKPCIDMQDEGYNCEWSQELTIGESFQEYLNAWIIIHILNHHLNRGNDPGVIFNMSAGYNMEGILKENMQGFLGKMNNCSEELKAAISGIRDIFPQVDDISFPSQISDNITLSTMHGCPANEIEEIAGYLLEKKNLHTFVKLNPTLLGPDKLREILNRKLKFNTIVPDAAFEHDLKYPDAVKMIKSLSEKAKSGNLTFGLKLTNTLESVNNKDVFGREEKMMYMSGRALHPLTVNLAVKLQEDLNGELLLSFSGGADAFNISKLMACGFKTVTVCSDLLKPGGYMRLHQYFDRLQEDFQSAGAVSPEKFILKSSGLRELKEAALSNLRRYADEVLVSGRYKRETIKPPDIKTSRELGTFDCISAPCRDTCATNQDIPDYLYFTSTGQPGKAFETVLRTNPFPSVTGMVCDHLCQNKCTRINYDDPLLIREVKRFISEQKEIKLSPCGKNGKSAAITGAGPSGLTCAYYLALKGFTVDVFESRSKAGGMVRFAIPGFRLTDEAIDRDITRITEAGVSIHYEHSVDANVFRSLQEKFDYVYIGAGAQLSAPLDIPGADAEGVLDPLEFLFDVKQGKKEGFGRNVVIIGGGNTAMDAARTAWRLTCNDGKVTIVYRRTINEMPADQGEIKAVLEEGVEIIELTAPERIITEKGHVKALVCSQMKLTVFDKTGRPQPVKIPDSEFEIPCDTIIPAIGQKRDIDFAPDGLLATDGKSCSTGFQNVLIGGDALRGASTAINAIGDGRKAAEEILRRSGTIPDNRIPDYTKNLSHKELIIKRSQRIYAEKPAELPLSDRKNFRLVSFPPDRDSIIKEAARCLWCDELCDICTTVCPNFANYGYEITPVRFDLSCAELKPDGSVEINKDGIFEVTQKYQILNIANFCNDCGNCNTFCPAASAPYREKPKFWLTISSFNQAEEGYYLARLPNRSNLIFKHQGNITTLTEFAAEYLFETDYVSARFSKPDFKPLEVRFSTPCVKKVSFRHAAEMTILMKGAESLEFET